MNFYGKLDYTCGMYDDDMNIIATGSCFGNTFRYLTVSSKYQDDTPIFQIILKILLKIK